ncbi:MAG: hypothetical protein ACAH12_06140 [Methylophilaceae bacterium]
MIHGKFDLPSRGKRQRVYLAPMTRMRGQSMVEYFIVTAMAVLVLLALGPNGEPSAIQSVIDAMKQAYAGFTFALGYSSTLMVF